MSISIREATEADAPALASLRYEFRAGIGNAVESRDEFVARCSEWMVERLGEGSAWRCWVVEGADGSIQGHLWLQVVEKVPNPVAELERHGYITNVYVDPGARGSGAGTALMEAAMAWCRENRTDSAFLWPTERSRSLYARFGFEVPGDMMEATGTPGRDLDGRG